MDEPLPIGTPMLGDHVWLKLPITSEMDSALSALSHETQISKRSLVRTAVVALLHTSGYPEIIDPKPTRHNRK
ncbi:hypothetical protein GCM10027403_14880 [Arthrobacter tecti]